MKLEAAWYNLSPEEQSVARRISADEVAEEAALAALCHRSALKPSVPPHFMEVDPPHLSVVPPGPQVLRKILCQGALFSPSDYNLSSDEVISPPQVKVVPPRLQSLGKSTDVDSLFSPWAIDLNSEQMARNLPRVKVSPPCLSVIRIAAGAEPPVALNSLKTPLGIPDTDINSRVYTMKVESPLLQTAPPRLPILGNISGSDSPVTRNLISDKPSEEYLEEATIFVSLWYGREAISARPLPRYRAPPNNSPLTPPVFYYGPTGIFISRECSPQGDRLLLFSMNDNLVVAPERGWMCLQERQYFSVFMKLEAAWYNLSPEEQSVARRISADEVAEEAALAALCHRSALKPSVPPHPFRHPPPDAKRELTPAGHYTNFVLCNDNVWVIRYNGSRVRNPSYIMPTRMDQAEEMVETWRLSGPGPRSGFQSKQERQEFHEWILWRHAVKIAEDEGKPLPPHPDDVLQAHPPILRFDRSHGVYEDKADLSLCQHEEETPASPLIEPANDICIVPAVNNRQDARINDLLEAAVISLPIHVPVPPSSSSAVLGNVVDPPSDNSIPTRITRRSPLSGRPRSQNLSSSRATAPTPIEKNKTRNRDLGRERRENTQEGHRRRVEVKKIPHQRPDQKNWPIAQWTYGLGRYDQKHPPKMYRGKDGIIRPIDLPRKYYNPQVPQVAANPAWLDPNISTYDLLLAEQFDPDYRGLSTSLIREHYFADAERLRFPPDAINTPEYQQRWDNRIHGQNAGDDCILCFGAHFMTYCPIFPLAEDRLRILTLRGHCQRCRQIHRAVCHAKPSTLRLCPSAKCNEELGEHHKDLCNLADHDRRAYHPSD